MLSSSPKGLTGQIFSLFLASFMLIIPAASALSPEQQKIYKENILYHDVASCDASTDSCSCGGGTFTGGSDEEREAFIFNYLVNAMGLKPFQAAGVMGSMQVESGFEPERQESIFDKKVAAENFPNPAGGPGWGFVQWTPGSKMIDTFSPKSKANDLGNQLKFLQDQLDGKGPLPEKAAGDQLKASTDIVSATLAFELGYERHAGGAQPERVRNARNILANPKISGGGAPSGTTVCATTGGGEVVGQYSLPVDKKWYTQHPDWFTKPHHLHHDGSPDIASDIPVPTGTPIYSMSAGTIIAAPNEGGYGKGVTIDAGNGVKFIYGHGSDGGSVPGAKNGDKVQPGQLIMHADTTGQATGPHLHVTIEIDGVDHCPQTFFVGIAEGHPPDIKSLPTSGCSG